MNPLFRLGLPPGSALVLIGMIELMNPIMVLVIDYGGLLAQKQLGTRDVAPWEEGLWLAFMVLWLGVSGGTLLYGVIFRGMKLMMLIWMGATTTFFGIFIIIELVFFDWTFSDGIRVLSTTYVFLMTTIIVLYELHLAKQCLPSFATIADLEPIGKGWRFIVDYYKTHAKEAAALVLMFEIVFNVEIFLERQMSRFVFGHQFMGHENDTNAAVLTEETILRYVRIGLAIVGFAIAYKEKQYWMFRWCLCYMVTIAISLGIFVYLIFMWRAEHVILTLAYFGMTIINLLYRTGVLFMCVRYTDVFERRGIPM